MTYITKAAALPDNCLCQKSTTKSQVTHTISPLYFLPLHTDKQNIYIKISIARWYNDLTFW